MRFSIQREQLLRPLQLVTGVVERRQTLPVLANLLFRTQDNGLEITGTDLEVELVASVEGSVEQAGEATLPARKLADIWRSLGDGVDVSVAIEGDRAIVRSGRSRFSLATLPAADFPKVERGDADVSIEVSQDALRGLIDDVAFAMAQQDVRYFLNGMLLEVTDQHLRAQEKISISSYNIIYEVLDFIKNKMSGLLSPDVEEQIIGSAEILEIFKVSKVGKVAGSKVIDGEITNNSSARIIRDGVIIYNGKIGSIFREKNQAKQVSAGLECGITLKDFSDFQKNDIIEVYNSKITERRI